MTRLDVFPITEKITSDAIDILTERSRLSYVVTEKIPSLYMSPEMQAMLQQNPKTAIEEASDFQKKIIPWNELELDESTFRGMYIRFF